VEDGKPKFSTVDAAIEAYVALRDELREFQRGVKTREDLLKSQLDEISMWLRDKADEIGVDSFKTKHGTAYRNLKESYRIGDWDAFVAYIKETDNFQLFEKRVAKNAAKEIHREGQIPPGLDYVTEVEFNVLRPKKTTEEKQDA
jgi:hypothetical protein